jgi:hypothetical protein
MKGFLKKAAHALLKQNGYALSPDRVRYWTDFPNGIKVIEIKNKFLKSGSNYSVNIELGVYWPDVEALVPGGGFYMVRPPPFACTLSLSLSYIVTNTSSWWTYNKETEKQVSNEIVHLLKAKGFSWLEKCENPNGLLNELTAVNSKERVIALRKLMAAGPGKEA